jgi:hypothetical protein
MNTKTKYWIFALLLTSFVLLAAALPLPRNVSAAPAADSLSNSCLTCHEDLYYLHDSGCWYCMTDAHKDRCTDCHEGNPTAFKEEAAHFGYLPHPQEDDGAKCKQCHEADSQEWIDTFASESGGFDKVVEPVAYIPVQPVETGFPETAQPGFVEKLPWVVGAVALFGFWLALVLLSPRKP